MDEIEEMPIIRAHVRMAEKGGVYKPGDEIDVEALDYERLVFLIAKGHAGPEDAEELPEQLFLDVMERRD
mgnify:CR=1 FL=1